MALRDMLVNIASGFASGLVAGALMYPVVPTSQSPPTKQAIFYLLHFTAALLLQHQCIKLYHRFTRRNVPLPPLPPPRIVYAYDPIVPREPKELLGA